MWIKVMRTLDEGIDKFALYGLVVCIWGMLLLSLGTIVLRWFQITFLWVDPLVRHLVFLSAFLGGVLATGRRLHIGIDIINKILEKKGKLKLFRSFSRIVDLVCAGTLIWLAVGSVQFVKDTFAYEGVVFLGIHSGFLVSIIPVGLALMAYRYLFLFVNSFVEIVTPEKLQEQQLQHLQMKH